MKETFSLDFIQELNIHQKKSYEKVMEETNKNFSLVAKEIIDVSQNLQTTLSQMNHNNNALKAQKEIHQSIQEFTNASKSFDKTLAQTFDKIDNEIGQIVIKLADFATHVSLESSAVQESISKYHKLIASQIKEK